MSLYGMINVGVQFNLDKLKDNIDTFKALYGVNTEQEVYHRYLSDMSKHLTDAVAKVDDVSFESRLVGIQEAGEETVDSEPIPEYPADEAWSDDDEPDVDEEVSDEVNNIISNIDKVGIEHGLVTKVVVSELNPRLKNFTKLIGVPVETAEMGEDYYLVYEAYGSGEEKHWNPEGDK